MRKRKKEIRKVEEEKEKERENEEKEIRKKKRKRNRETMGDEGKARRKSVHCGELAGDFADNDGGKGDVR